MLTHFGLAQLKWDMLREQEAATGEKRLLLAVFCEQHFPDFPYYLGCRTLKRIKETHSLTRLLLKFEKTDMLKQYDLLRAQDQGRPVGLVFRWGGFSHGVVLHNGQSGSTGAHFQWSHEDGSQLVLEPFKQFIERIPWSPR